MPNQMKLFILLCSAKAVFSKTEILSHKFGDNVVLKPDSRTNPPSSILWRLGQNKVADFDTDFGPDVTYYGDFNGRTTLDKTTGELTITGLRKTDEGVYSVEFNSKRLEKTYTLSVLKPVPKPTIIVSCNDNKISCTLTCNGDTAGAEPVTYWWKVGEGNWEGIGKLLTVAKSDSKLHQKGYKYTCKLNNSVSEKVSDPIGPLFDPKPVPKPTIIVSCNDNKISCTLTCDGDTAGAEPVTYWWKVGEGNWEGIGKLLTVAKIDSKLNQNGLKYTCKLKNGVSEKDSDLVGPLFDPKSSSTTWIVIIVPIVFFVLIGYLLWKKITDYPNDSVKEFLLKILHHLCVFCHCTGETNNSQTPRSTETVYCTVGDGLVDNCGAAGVPTLRSTDTGCSFVGAKDGEGLNPPTGNRLESQKKESDEEKTNAETPLTTKAKD
uniref:Ig-like domain-containing protein n=1 Tax=Esox lucius TaxID=8010 RepID=A0A3P8XEG6_ESOLU